MEHKVNLEEISDGRIYSLSNLAPLSCSGCNGKASCCCFAEDTITLDPFDLFLFQKAGLGSFSELVEQEIISLSPEDSLLLPHLKFSKVTGKCPFLDANGRCKIHASRPGLCRLFPLAKYFHEDKLSFILQVHECPEQGKKPIPIVDWLSVEDSSAYEDFLLSWHRLLAKAKKALADADSRETLLKLTVLFLSSFFQTPYRTETGFEEQYSTRLDAFLTTAKL